VSEDAGIEPNPGLLRLCHWQSDVPTTRPELCKFLYNYGDTNGSCLIKKTRSKNNATGNCLAIIRIEHGSLRDLSDLLLAIAPETIPDGTVFLLGSLTQLQNEGLQGYSSSGVRYGKKNCGEFQKHDSFVTQSLFGT
jgi:hypothetical protein